MTINPDNLFCNLCQTCTGRRTSKNRIWVAVPLILLMSLKSSTARLGLSRSSGSLWMRPADPKHTMPMTVLLTTKSWIPSKTSRTWITSSKTIQNVTTSLLVPISAPFIINRALTLRISIKIKLWRLILLGISRLLWRPKIPANRWLLKIREINRRFSLMMGW